MASENDTPVDLYIAAYADPQAAQGDWDAIKEMAKQKTITVDGLVLVSRGMDGKIDVKDNFHTVGHGAAWGAGAGLLIGLIFPPALLASGLVGAAAGAGIGGLVSHSEKGEIKDEVQDDVPPGKLRDRGAVRAALGGGHPEGAAEGQQGLEARGRQAERRAGEGCDDERLDSWSRAVLLPTGSSSYGNWGRRGATTPRGVDARGSDLGHPDCPEPPTGWRSIRSGAWKTAR